MIYDDLEYKHENNSLSSYILKAVMPTYNPLYFHLNALFECINSYLIFYQDEKSLKPIFEHLRQIKTQEKKAYSENLFLLHRTLENRSDSVK